MFHQISYIPDPANFICVMHSTSVIDRVPLNDVNEETITYIFKRKLTTLHRSQHLGKPCSVDWVNSI